MTEVEDEAGEGFLLWGKLGKLSKLLSQLITAPLSTSLKPAQESNNPKKYILFNEFRGVYSSIFASPGDRH